ncbi:MAG: CinA family protein [Hyphomonadaceae bacterium]|nr:CinA family protein [Hyphomonadaceae bacterium]
MTETLSATLPNDVEHLVAVVLKKACEQELKLATAESCTGGLLASLLTDVEGCAHVFDRGFVVYTNDAKTDLLGVAPEVLARLTAVSPEVAAAMATGALLRSDADIAVAVTGFAGRGGPGEEPGLVYIAVAQAGRASRVEEQHFGDVGRGAVRLACLRHALKMLQDSLG